MDKQEVRMMIESMEKEVKKQLAATVTADNFSMMSEVNTAMDDFWKTITNLNEKYNENKWVGGDLEGTNYLYQGD